MTVVNSGTSNNFMVDWLWGCWLVAAKHLALLCFVLLCFVLLLGSLVRDQASSVRCFWFWLLLFGFLFCVVLVLYSFHFRLVLRALCFLLKLHEEFLLVRLLLISCSGFPRMTRLGRAATLFLLLFDELVSTSGKSDANDNDSEEQLWRSAFVVISPFLLLVPCLVLAQSPTFLATSFSFSKPKSNVCVLVSQCGWFD